MNKDIKDINDGHISVRVPKVVSDKIAEMAKGYDNKGAVLVELLKSFEKSQIVDTNVNVTTDIDAIEKAMKTILSAAKNIATKSEIFVAEKATELSEKDLKLKLEAQEEIQSEKDRADAILQERNEIETKLASIVEEKESFELENAELHSRINELYTKLNNNENLVAKLEKEKSDLLNAKSDLVAKNTEYATEFMNLQKELKGLSKLQNENSKLITECEKQKDSVAVLKEKLASADAKETELSNECVTLKNENSKIVLLELQLEQFDSTKNNLDAANAKIENLKAENNQIAVQNAEMKMMKSEIDSLKKEREQLLNSVLASNSEKKEQLVAKSTKKVAKKEDK